MLKNYNLFFFIFEIIFQWIPRHIQKKILGINSARKLTIFFKVFHIRGEVFSLVNTFLYCFNLFWNNKWIQSSRKIFSNKNSNVSIRNIWAAQNTNSGGKETCTWYAWNYTTRRRASDDSSDCRWDFLLFFVNTFSNIAKIYAAFKLVTFKRVILKLRVNGTLIKDDRLNIYLTYHLFTSFSDFRFTRT